MTQGHRLLHALLLPALAGLGAALAAPPAHAHQVWLEQDGKYGKLCFGEYAANLRERSPGRLDKFGAPTALRLTPKGETPLTVAKAADGFVLSGRAARGESLVVEDTRYPVVERKPRAGAPEGGKPAADAKPVRTAWTPAARYITDFRAQPARLTLDVVPAGKPGDFQVIFRGKPLPAAKVDILLPAGWGREGETDKDGKVSFPLPWKANYLVKVNHVDPTPGKRPGATGDEGYESASFSTTLAFATPSGLPAPPAPPPAAHE